MALGSIANLVLLDLIWMLNFDSMILLASAIMLFVALNMPMRIYGKVLTVYAVAAGFVVYFGMRWYYLGYLVAVLAKDIKMDIFLIKRRRDINWRVHLKNLVYFLIFERVWQLLLALLGWTPVIATIAGTYKYAFLCPEYTYSSYFFCESEFCTDGYILGVDGFCHLVET